MSAHRTGTAIASRDPEAVPAMAPGPESVPLRFVTATALFDGHDAAIHVFRRVLHQEGAEVIHLGHNRGAAEIATAAVEEDADAVAVSSYQGGHNEFFRYLVDLLGDAGRPDLRVFGGGGGVIRPEEAVALEQYGVARIYSPEAGGSLGIVGIVRDMLADAARARRARPEPSFEALLAGLRDAPPPRAVVAALLRRADERRLAPDERAALEERVLLLGLSAAPVLGVTGTGGAGKSSLLDELLERFRTRRPQLPGAAAPPDRIGVLAVDPTRRRTGGALLGDRIRLNAAGAPEIFTRSLATRGSGTEVTGAIEDAILVLRAAGFGLIVVETGGIGQGSSAIVDVSTVPLYVMTSDYGSDSQLEKIDMLDLAAAVALNKADHPGAEDALFAVRRAFRRARGLPRAAPVPVFPTVASQFADPGTDELFRFLVDALGPSEPPPAAASVAGAGPPDALVADFDAVPPTRLIPAARAGYLAEIAETLRSERKRVEDEVRTAARAEHLEAAARELEAAGAPVEAAGVVASRARDARSSLDPSSRALLDEWPQLEAAYRSPKTAYAVRGRMREVETRRESLSGTPVPRVALPEFLGQGDTLRFLLDENVPGRYPFTAGAFAFRRPEENPRRQFAGEGGPARTNRRFHLLSEGEDATRLSVAFDSVTLYGEDPARRPDIFGKVGEGGVSIATLDDMCDLFEGFRLADPATSVSMTINGPAPTILAMFLNAAIRQEAARFEADRGRAPSPEEAAEIRSGTLRTVRGTTQADILKEDQAQNTCIFSTAFALRLMGDVQEFFTTEGVRNFYSASISGYHIAEAGAWPVTQLAFTLANGFTYVEYYLARGLRVDDFGPNLSFFFSNGLDPEYAVLCRVARRIWARAMKLRYGASERAQKLKVHIQTSGRSLHAQEVQFNDIRTTLQALTATSDNANSLHTNAYDEAITTPTEESVRRAVAIQQIITREFGNTWNENPLSGAFITRELTDLVEEAVLREFDRLHARGGVLGAMERQYQRNRIQEESLQYEVRKHSGEIPIMGVNTFLAEGEAEAVESVPLARASADEKEDQVRRVEDFRRRHAGEAPAALARLQEVAGSGGNVFAELMETVKVASLGQITGALYEVGGQYRRSM